MDRLTRVVLLLLFASAGAAGAGTLPLRVQTVSADGTVAIHEAPLARGAIIELAAPRAAASGQRAARAAMLAQLRGDLERVAAIPASRIRHEYSAVFFGAAVDARPEALASLRTLGYVRAIHPDRIVRAYQAAPPIDARPRVNATSFAGGNGIVVAILDTGIDYTHPALGGGYGPSFKVIGGHDFVNDDGDAMDDHGHGTHVAGIVAADGDGLVGVAPKARLLAFKVLDNGGSGSTSDIIAAIERSLDPNGDGDRADAADVINLSLGGPGTANDPLSRAIDSVVAQGVVAVVAAGNAGATATIGSPGTAASAITVGAVDGTGVIAPFSSRGPTSKLLTFKPEIMAPGVAIFSARRGGGLVAASGTSMATPHVAGAAALLRELHPEWSPARVKAAIVSGAIAMPGSGFARGAGRIDAVRAANASTLVAEGGLSFGLVPEASGIVQRSGSVTVTNAAATAETFVLAPPDAIAGITVTAEPSRVELAPGASASIRVGVSVDTALAAAPDGLATGGDLRFNNLRGTGSFAIPWAMLRAARATITYDGLTGAVIPLADTTSADAIPYGDGEFEMFVKPGVTWDFILVGVEIAEGERRPHALRFLVAEKKVVDGDIAIPFASAAASVRLTYGGRDVEGRRLADLPVEEGLRQHVTTVRLHLADGARTFGLMIQEWGLRDLYVSPTSARYTLIPYELYIDAMDMKGYAVQHAAFQAPSASATLETSPSTYLHATLRWERPPAPAEPFIVCAGDAYTASGALVYGAGSCHGRDVGGPVAFDFYANSGTRDDAFAGLMFVNGSAITPVFRGVDGAIVASAEPKPSRTAPRIPHGGEATIGGGIFFPFAFHGTTSGLVVYWPLANFFGPYGEALRDDTFPSHWETFDAVGNRTGRGVIARGGSIPPAGVNGSRLVVRREWRHQSGLTSAGTLAVVFAAAGNDLTAPTVTSMSVVDAAGRPLSQLAAGAAGTLRFSAGDLDHGKRMEVQPMKSGGTRALWRRAGAAAWEPLALALVETEEGSTSTLGHVPAGDVWTADLGAATAAPGLVDLRIELEDLAGNTMTWTQEGALFVGGESAPPVRGRKVRRP